MNRNYVLICLLLASLSCTWGQTFACDLPEFPLWNTVYPEVTARLPVFFATDRTFTGSAKQFSFNQMDKDRLNCGLCMMRTRLSINDVNHKFLGHLKSIGGGCDFTATVKEKMGIRSVDANMSVDELIFALRDAIHKSNTNQLVINVHGCCVTFPETTCGASEFALWTRVPVLLYAWSTPGISEKLPIPYKTTYDYSEYHAERTKNRFNVLMARILEAFPDVRVSIVCHSLGTRIVTDFCRTAKYLKRQPNEIFFLNSDIDVEDFLQYKNDIQASADRIFVFISTNDQTLGLSEYRHDERPRLGRPRQKLNDLLKVKQLTVYDVSALNLGHSIPYSIVANMIRNDGILKGDPEFAPFGTKTANFFKLKRYRTLR